MVALLGPSGSGKSTLLNIIGCITDPSEGKNSLGGKMVHHNKWLRSDLRPLRLDKVGFIFHAQNLLPFLNPTDNVALVLQLAGNPATQAQARARDLLEDLEVGHRARAMPALLSGGEARRVAGARAQANSPRIILAAEPTAAFDSKRAGIVVDLLRKLAAEQDACIIAVTHDEKILDRFDRLFHLRDGHPEGDKREPNCRRNDLDPLACGSRRASPWCSAR